MDSKASYILLKVSAQLPKIGELMMAAKDKLKAVSSRGRTVTPTTSYSKARIVA
jgi:hypothetical protein